MQTPAVLPSSAPANRQTQTKMFDDTPAAQKQAEKLIGEKFKKGYSEAVAK